MLKLGTEPEPKMPIDLQEALNRSPKLLEKWNDLTPIARRDFVRWIECAKQEETRKRRINVALSKLAAGKRRPCCYEVVPMELYKALWTNPKAKAGWRILTPTQRRDYVDWIDKTKRSGNSKIQIEKACVMLASGKPHP